MGGDQVKGGRARWPHCLYRSKRLSHDCPRHLPLPITVIIMFCKKKDKVMKKGKKRMRMNVTTGIGRIWPTWPGSRQWQPQDGLSDDREGRRVRVVEKEV